jgi:isoleucyl-tRNA synthetase
MAPITPHLSEEIYQNLIKSVKSDAKESIHMEDWSFDESKIDNNLEQMMDSVRNVIEAAARARDVVRYKLRWPVNDITVVSQDDNILNAVKHLENIIKDQSNTKNVITSKEFENISFIAKPNLKILGPKLKGDVGLVKKHFSSADGNLIKEEIETNGFYIVKGKDREGNLKEIKLSSDEVLYDTELPENVVSSEFDGGNVFVNTEVTPEILSEAMSRELIRRIQDMRKDMDLDVEDMIGVMVHSSSEFKNLVNKQADFIQNEVRATTLALFDGEACVCVPDYEPRKDEYTKQWKIEDEDVMISIVKK